MKSIVLKFLFVTVFILIANSEVYSQANTPHEVRLGIGTIWYPNYKRHYEYGNINDYYYGNKIGTPFINMAYSYQFKPWFSLGATVTYAGTYQKTFNLYIDAVHSKLTEHFVGVTPMIRFDWLRTKTVKLYSNIGFGLGYAINRERNAMTDYKWRESAIVPTIDLTPIGVTVGQKLFGFCELGLSNIGFVKAGIGYRFNEKSNRKL